MQFKYILQVLNYNEYLLYLKNYKNRMVLDKKCLSPSPVFFRIVSPRLIFLLLVICLLAGCSASKKKRKSNYHPPKRTETRTETNGPKTTSTVDKIIQTARSFTGTPYKWGGTTRAGMDCSGLLVISFRSAGITLPRTSAAQSKYGKNVSIHDLQPGDLVFFTAGKYSGKITHVGMVTEVKGRDNVTFIHASSSLGVIENNLFSDYYRNIFAKAVRPF